MNQLFGVLDVDVLDQHGVLFKFSNVVGYNDE